MEAFWRLYPYVLIDQTAHFVRVVDFRYCYEAFQYYGQSSRALRQGVAAVELRLVVINRHKEIEMVLEEDETRLEIEDPEHRYRRP